MGRIEQTLPMRDPADKDSRAENRLVGTEAAKTIEAKHRSGFVARYLSGANILDIGFRGYFQNAEPIVAQAIGIDLEYPGYDGKTLPFEDNSQDAVFSSHCLEHIADYKGALREWYRVLRVGGFMIISVPHQYLYEKRNALPSRWNQDHKRFYTPASLMAEVESALAPNTYRLRHLIDNDVGFTYSAPPELHSAGSYEIEMVLEKIARPSWGIVPNVMTVDIGPQTDVIQWSGFSACESGFRWTTGERASMKFDLSAELTAAVLAAQAAISLTIQTFGRQRIRASLNGQPVYSKTLEGNGLVLDIPTAPLRQGPNTLDFDLPDAIRPAAAADPRHLGIAVCNIRLVRTPPVIESPVQRVGRWDALRRLFGRN
jgi:SAM-dependent methyltransferase